jgi:hypothetical protein
MKQVNALILILTIAAASGCNSKRDCRQTIDKMTMELAAGNLTSVQNLADEVRRSCSNDKAAVEKADSLAQMAERIGIDFSVREDQVEAKLAKLIGQYSKEEKAEWENKGWLEYRLIEGRKTYFKRAASNLVLLRKFREEHEKWIKETAEDPEMVFRLKHTSEAYQASGGEGKPVVPVTMAITYTITVHPDAVPEGETIRCWMPWPKSNHQRQKNIELLHTSCQEYIISPDTAIHSTLYMEETAKKGVPSIFSISFRYRSFAQYFKIPALRIQPYDRNSDIYKKYTSEQLPQISFPDNVKHLADSITGSEENPAEIVRKIYMWFKESIPWARALEYSIMTDIPQYVLQNRRGDCGMQTFLYISMLRYKGIPVKWQSGWMLPPKAENLHDWCEIYFEGTGWIPSDISYDLQSSTKREIREYYLSGIDAYRLIVNDGVAGNLYPHKNFMRSEPYDFQRGEVEWKGGNLYFDKWDYDIRIDYLK